MCIVAQNLICFGQLDILKVLPIHLQDLRAAQKIRRIYISHVFQRIDRISKTEDYLSITYAIWSVD